MGIKKSINLERLTDERFPPGSLQQPNHLVMIGGHSVLIIVWALTFLALLVAIGQYQLPQLPVPPSPPPTPSADNVEAYQAAIRAYEQGLQTYRVSREVTGRGALKVLRLAFDGLLPVLTGVLGFLFGRQTKYTPSGPLPAVPSSSYTP